MRRRIERAPLPDSATLKRLLSERAPELADGAALVDGDAQGSTGVDLVLVDETGRPVFVDVLSGDTASLPARVFDHLEWVERNRRLFLRAYSGDGVVKAEDPVFVFVAGEFPRSIVRAVGALSGVSVKLVRAEHFLIDGEGELVLEEVPVSGGPEVSPVVVRKTGEASGGAPSGLEEAIESDSVRALLALFRSGVDGLDGRIAVSESDGGITFELEGRRLAHVTVSPGSFTVTAGERQTNPIVVSDRVSLERALNAVVSLFVREEKASPGETVSGEPKLDEGERAELASIWGSGIGGEGG